MSNLARFKNINLESYIRGRILGRRPLSCEEIEIIQGNLCRNSCFYCDEHLPKRLTGMLGKTIDHIFPKKFNKEEDGFTYIEDTNSVTNIVISCYECNTVRGTIEFFDFCEFAENYIVKYKKDFNVIYKVILNEKPEKFSSRQFIRAIKKFGDLQKEGRFNRD